MYTTDSTGSLPVLLYSTTINSAFLYVETLFFSSEQNGRLLRSMKYGKLLSNHTACRSPLLCAITRVFCTGATGKSSFKADGKGERRLFFSEEARRIGGGGLFFIVPR